jgi:ABC-type antimicrobial peptide transport system permease subunit
VHPSSVCPQAVSLNFSLPTTTNSVLLLAFGFDSVIIIYPPLDNIIFQSLLEIKVLHIIINLSMNFLNPIKISYKNLLSAKLRSFLTILGIIIGVASVIIVMAIGASAQSLILDQVKGIGSNLIGILPGASEEKGPPASALGIITTTLKYRDLEAILEKKNVPNITDASGYVTGVATAKSQNDSLETDFQGVNSSLVNVEKSEVENGRFFIKEEDTNLSRVAVLGHKRATEFFPNNDAVGKTISLKNFNFTVIGTLKERGSVAFSNPDELIYIPLFTAQKELLGIDYLNLIRAKVDSAENIALVTNDIKLTLRNQHKIKDPKDDDFSVRDTEEALSLLTNVTNVLKYFLASIAAISLLVGGVGVMNIMLISVNQRIREIGLRKAVGAKNTHIVWQFLIESAIITFWGGIIGIILGVSISFLAAIVIKNLGYNWEFIVTFKSIILSTVVTVLIGIIFGMYPARKASRVSPMEALRYE